MVRRLWPVVLLLFAAPSVQAASVPAPPHPPIHAARASSEMRCDGILDEPAWAAAPPVTEFFQMTPNQGEQVSMRTDFRILFDDASLYIGARLYDAAPESIQAPLGRRDASLPADRITVYIDPYHDRRSGYLFVVNAAGLKVDGLLYNDGAQDLTWDAVWEGRPHRDSLGWTAELKIPFSQLRFQSGATPVWGINFKRVIYRRAEESLLAYTPRDGAGFVSRFPDLVGLDGIEPSGAIELAPYVTSKGEFTRHAPGDPFNDGSQMSARTGLDLRAPVGRRLTLNATVNPDFGQVEVDPAVVNLSDVESTFEEKRPYFVEGASNFRFGREGANSYWDFNWPEPRFFYSRRIGRAPQGLLPPNDYADVPIATTILGAAKLTGKITPTINFGTLQAVTGKEEANLSRAGNQWESPVEPPTYYGVTRALKEFSKGAGLGLLSTAVVRQFESDPLQHQLNDNSLFGGVDGWMFLDPNRLWALSGWVGASRIGGDRLRMTAVQRSSRHYFQRPDADHVDVDTSATTMTGVAGRLWLNKQSGRIMSNSALGVISPGFEVNDVGVQSRSDVINGHTMFGYQWTADGRFKRYASLWGSVSSNLNLAGDRTASRLSAGGNMTYRNNWNQWYGFGLNASASDPSLTRGGPLMRTPNQVYLETGGNTDAYRRRSYSLWTWFSRDDAGGYANEGGLTLDWKPKSNLLISIGPFVNNDRVDAQYVATIPDPAATDTYGLRYVFARLDQNTIGADLRLNWTFTPELSFETYVQPFFSSGRYDSYRALARPDSREFTPYAYPANPNFDIASLRGNAVARWEYRPGSALFLVWTQQREDIEGRGNLDLDRSMVRILDAEADNVFMVKVSYYLGL